MNGTCVRVCECVWSRVCVDLVPAAQLEGSLRSPHRLGPRVDYLTHSGILRV